MFIETEQLREKINYKLSQLSSKDWDTQIWVGSKYLQYLDAIALVERAEKEIYPQKY